MFWQNQLFIIVKINDCFWQSFWHYIRNAGSFTSKSPFRLRKSQYSKFLHERNFKNYCFGTKRFALQSNEI